jgi:hypothetical protein
VNQSIVFPFDWHSKHEDLYVNQKSAANVVVIDNPNNKQSIQGIVAFLSESHIPYKIYETFENISNDENLALIITTQKVEEKELEIVKGGTNLLVLGTNYPEIFENKVEKFWKAKDLPGSYFRVNDINQFPLLKEIELVELMTDYLELKAEEKSAFTLVPPSISSPTEITFLDNTNSNKPGIINEKIGEGTLKYIPWDISVQYFLHSSYNLNYLLTDVINSLLEDKNQIQTNAHPLVEISYMKQEDQKRSLMHFINLTGQLHGSNGQQIPMQDIQVKVRGNFNEIRLSSTGKRLSTEYKNGYTTFTIPTLEKYEVVIIK